MPLPCFHKLIVSSTIHAKRLRIPEHFVKKLREELSAVAKLTLPDGHVWQVGLRKVENGVWIQDGWHEFVERYGIRIGYFLVFTYEGNSGFFVRMFNLTNSEINYHSSSLRNTQGLNYGNQYNVFEEMEDDDTAEIPGLSPSCLTTGPLKNKFFGECGDQLTPSRSYTTPSLQNLFKWGEGNLHPSKGVNRSPGVIQPSRDIGVQFNAVEFKKSFDEVKLQSPDQESLTIKKTVRKKRKPNPNDQDSSASQEQEAEMRFRFYESASARKRMVTTEERERVINAAKAFEPTNPFCRVVLRPSYLYRGCIMYLPSCFAEKHLNGVSEFIKLQTPDGKQWSVRCLYRGGRAKLSQGWYEFSLENNLGEGDVCVFELMKMRDIVLKVMIFRVLEDTGLVVNQPLRQNVSQTKLIRS